MRSLLLLTAALLLCGCPVQAPHVVSTSVAESDEATIAAPANESDAAETTIAPDTEELDEEGKEEEKIVELQLEELRCEREDADYVLTIDVIVLGLDNTWSFEFPLRAPKRHTLYLGAGGYSCSRTVGGKSGNGGEGIGVGLNRKEDGQLTFDVSIRRSWNGVVEADFEIDEALIDEPVSGRRALDNGITIQWRFTTLQGAQL